MRNPEGCLDLYRLPYQYDIEYGDYADDIPYYLARLGSIPGPVLELACGTGRVTLPLARAGYDITGLDFSEDMLGLAQEKASAANLHADWVWSDCRSFRLGRLYSRILLPFNSLCHLHDRESVEACFSRVVEHLAVNGQFILDLANPSYELLTCDLDDNAPVAEYCDVNTGQMVLIREQAVYDESAQTKCITWTYYIGERLLRTAYLDMRLFYPMEMEALLHYSGLKVIERLGGYAGEPYTFRCSRQLLVCEART